MTLMSIARLLLSFRDWASLKKSWRYSLLRTGKHISNAFKIIAAIPVEQLVKSLRRQE